MNICIPCYEGLLTHLVRMILNGEIDVFSLRVAEVVDQVIEQILCPDSPYDTDDASAQMVLCATIMRTKSRRMLPVEEDSAPEEDEAEAAMLEEERALRCLVEYQHFQTVAGVLNEMAEESAKLFTRGNTEIPDGDDRQDLSHVSLLSLVAALEKALDNRDPAPMSVDTGGYSMHEGLSYLRELLASGKRTAFSQIFPRGAGRLVIVVVFLGLLELIRTGEVKVNERDGRIYVRKEGAVSA